MSYTQREMLQSINLSNMSGGINTARQPEMIAENECEDAVNFEFDFDRIKVRNGLSAAISTYQNNIKAVFYIPVTNTGVVVLENGTVYEDDFIGTSILVGSVTGTTRPSFCRYDNKCFIASGGKLQYIDYPDIGSTTTSIRITINSLVAYYNDTSRTLQIDSSISSTTALTNGTYRLNVTSSSTTHSVSTIADSPNCSIVLERAGRVVVANAGSDRVHYSAVGNPYSATAVSPLGTENPSDEGWYEKDSTTGVYSLTEDTTVVSGKTYYSDYGGWQEDTDVDSSYKWIDVGYKADGDILTIIPMASDLMVFKSGGTVYSLASEYPNWTIQEISKGTDVMVSNSVAPIPNSVAYISARGLFGINTSVAYGNFNIEELGYKINKNMAYKTRAPRVYSLPRKSQLLICQNTVVSPNELWCYHWSTKASTRLKFPITMGMVNDVIDTIDGPIIAIGNKLYRWLDIYQDDNGTPIESTIKSRVMLGGDKTVVRSVDTMLSSTVANQTATVTINDVERNGHTITLSVPTNARKKKLCNHSTRKVQVEVTATSRYELENLSLEATGFSR